MRLAPGMADHEKSADRNTLAEGGHPVPAYGAPLPHRSTHVIFHFDDGSVLYLTDIRQFGRVWILPESGVQPLLDQAKLGPEPLDPEFTVDVLRERLTRRQKMPLKPILLDQKVVGGSLSSKVMGTVSRVLPDNVKAIGSRLISSPHGQ